MNLFILALVAFSIGLSQAAVHFSKSSLYDIYDFVGATEVRLTPCDSGCYIFASTVGHGYPDLSKFDPYANNLLISRDGGKSGTNITALSFNYGITQSKRPLIIPRGSAVSVFNHNGPSDKFFSIVLYVVDTRVAGDIDAQFEMYDALHLDRQMMAPQRVTTVMSAVPFTITVKGEEGKKNFATARLTGFDNALDEHDDECAIAYQTPSTAATMPDLELYATVPIVSLTFSEVGAWVKIGANTKFYQTVEFYNDGFISSAGWNGCKNRNSGGYQSFRSPLYITSNAYMLMTNDDYFSMHLEGEFHTDDNHTLTVRDLTNWKDEYWYGSYEEGTSQKKLDIGKTYFCEFKSREMEGDQGFIVRHYGKRLVEGGETTTSSSPSKSTESYCECDVDKFGMPLNWASTDIWLDVVIVLDTSEALSQQSLQNAGSFIESLLGDDDFDVLTTDHKAPFYTRVGVIAMADVPQILYDLNMTKKDTVRDRVSIKKGLSVIDFNSAFTAAQSMLANGLKYEPTRASTRQVVHFITNSPSDDSPSIAQFKASGGVIIVNDVSNEGEKPKSGLKFLASDGYFFSDVSDYMKNVQALCKANCFCSSGRVSFAGTGSDPALQASGGCYSASVAGVSYSKAKQSCADSRGGIIASVHSDEKGAFLHKLISDALPRQYYYWIGYAKGDDNVWRWEDQGCSTDSYTNWGKDEPSVSSVAKCAYVDQSVSTLPWGAGNCQTGFPYACEYAPCSVGNKNC